MWREIARRMFVSVLAVALATALIARSANAGNASASAVDVSAAMTLGTDMPIHGRCNGCAGHEKAMAPAACSAFCGTITALSLALVAYNPVPAETVGPRIAVAASGLSIPPDPYPPRPASMN